MWRLSAERRAKGTSKAPSDDQDWGGGLLLLSLTLYYFAPMAGAAAAAFARRGLARRRYGLVLALCAAPFALYQLLWAYAFLSASWDAGLSADGYAFLLNALFFFRALQGVAVLALFVATARRLIDAGAPPWPAALFTPIPLLIGQYSGGWIVAGIAAVALAIIAAAPPRRPRPVEAARTFE